MNRSVYAAFAALGLIWGSNFIFMKWAAALITPAQIVLVRVLFGFLPILLLALWRGACKREHLRHWPHFFVMSILATTFYYYAFARGSGLLPSSIAGMLSGAIPLFTFLATTLFLRIERPTARQWLGIALGLAGVALIARPWSASLNATGARISVEGAVCMVLGSLSLGVSFVYARRFLTPLAIAPLALSTYQIGFSLAVLALLTPIHGLDHITTDPRAFLGLVFGLGLSGTGLAYVLYYTIVQRMGAVSASAVTYIPPPVALLIGTLLVGEAFRPFDLVAMACILAGVYAIQSGRRIERTDIKAV